jgi:hypothetical protein
MADLDRHARAAGDTTLTVECESSMDEKSWPARCREYADREPASGQILLMT